MSLILAIRCFFRVLFDRQFAAEVQPLLDPPANAKERLSAESLRLLAILQRDGRLLDFLLEDIAAYPDDQIGAAVRDIHRDCRNALTKYIELEPVMAGEEESTVQVPAGFDPAAIRLTGRVTGNPPFKGTLAHRGWRVKRLELPELSKSADPLLIAPAEVDVQ
jgi:hypothetical protein